jgi:hypothetical protein
LYQVKPSENLFRYINDTKKILKNKVKAENYGHLHVRVFVPLPIYGKDPELAGIHWGPFSVSEPIDYIKANENMADDYGDDDMN